jgi:2-aminoadipate transaminase
MATISFARGAPSLDIIDVEGLRAAALRAFDEDPGGTTAYGTAIGYPPLRALIASWHGVEPAEVLVTNGSMQADMFLFDELVSSGDEVIVERPSYDRTLLALRERGATISPIALDQDGIDTEALAEHLAGGHRPVLAHIIPTFQNPAGHTLSLERRERLLELADEHSLTIFEDDPYVALRFSGDGAPSMHTLAQQRGRSSVVYASSFSKTVCPGIRVGYLVGAAKLIARIVVRATNTYISPSMVSEAIVYQFVRSGALEGSIETVRAALRERAERICAALAREIPGASFSSPQGGYFLWVSLPEGVDSGELCRAAAEREVAIVDGDDFVVGGGSHAVRLAYAGVTPAEIDEGVARLAEAVAAITARA